MAIDIKALEDQIHTILEPVIINTDPNAILIIEPNEGNTPDSFVSMKYERLVKNGLTDIGEVDSDGNVTVKAQYDITFKFTSFGDNAKNILADLNFALTDNIIIHESLVAINLFQFGSTIKTDVPNFRDTAWEESDQITVSFHYAHEEVVHVSLIEQVTIDGIYKDITDVIVLQTTQTINAP